MVFLLLVVLMWKYRYKFLHKGIDVQRCRRRRARMDQWGFPKVLLDGIRAPSALKLYGP